jgi:hypothetical protein
MKYVKDLIGWPPASGMFRSHHPTPEQETIRDVVRVVGKRIEFNCKYGAENVAHSFLAPDEKTAVKLESILKDNIGNTLRSIEMVEI